MSESKYTAEQLLEGRHEYCLSWSEPCQACGPEGNDLAAHVEHRVTVHDAINMSRLAARSAGRPTAGRDEEHLMDFIAVHWAGVIPPEGLTRGREVTDGPRGLSLKLAKFAEYPEVLEAVWEEADREDKKILELAGGFGRAGGMTVSDAEDLAGVVRGRWRARADRLSTKLTEVLIILKREND